MTKLSEYRASYNALATKFAEFGKHAVAVAHNAVSNREEVSAPFVNQEHSILEMLEAGLGVEIDLHWSEKDSVLKACHSSSAECLPSLLGEILFEDVLKKISDFARENPDKPVLINLDNSSFSDLPGPQFTAAFEEAARLFVKYFPPQKVNTTEDHCAHETHEQLRWPKIVTEHHTWEFRWFVNSEIRAAPMAEAKARFDTELSKYNDAVAQREEKIIAIELSKLNDAVDRREEKIIAMLKERTLRAEYWEMFPYPDRSALESAEREYAVYSNPDIIWRDGVCTVPIPFLPNEFAQGLKPDAKHHYPFTSHQAAMKLMPSDEVCEFFQNYPEDHFSNCGIPISNCGIPTSIDSALGSVRTTHSKETINRLLECGVRFFKLDYAVIGEDQCDARQLEIERFNLELMQKEHDDNPEIARCLSLNHELEEIAKYPFPTNSAFLAPLIGKPLAELETLCAAAKYYSGIETEEYQKMIAGSADKYAHHSLVSTFLSAAALSAARKFPEVIDAPGARHLASCALKAAISAGDLYLYSQSIVPFGASLLAATLAEKSGCSPTTVTALSFGCSALVKMALDPGASLSYTLANMAAGMAGAAAANMAVNYFTGQAGSMTDADDPEPDLTFDLESGLLLSPYAQSLKSAEDNKDKER